MCFTGRDRAPTIECGGGGWAAVRELLAVVVSPHGEESAMIRLFRRRKTHPLLVKAKAWQADERAAAFGRLAELAATTPDPVRRGRR